MVRRALALLLTTAATLAGPTAAPAATAKAPKPKGELRVCGEGAPMDVFLDKGKSHREVRALAADTCKSFKVSRGQWAVTVNAACENFRDARLTSLTVDPADRALYYPEGGLGGARVERDSRTTVTAVWNCLGYANPASPAPDAPPPFGDASR